MFFRVYVCTPHTDTQTPTHTHICIKVKAKCIKSSDS